MRPITFRAGRVLVAAPAVAQSRLYTNDDLVKRPIAWTRTATPEELRALAEYQFRLPQACPAERARS